MPITTRAIRAQAAFRVSMIAVAESARVTARVELMDDAPVRDARCVWGEPRFLNILRTTFIEERGTKDDTTSAALGVSDRQARARAEAKPTRCGLQEIHILSTAVVHPTV